MTHLIDGGATDAPVAPPEADTNTKEGHRPMNTNSSPIEEVRAAARILHQTAAKATPGPWRIRQGNTVSSNITDRDGHMVIDGGGWTDGTKTVVYGAALNADAAWIALAGPELAGPLAAWLDALADGWEMSARFAQGGSDARFARHPALALARLINRSGS